MSERPVEIFRSTHGFPAESRFLDGHFPGTPIVPGAVILAYLAARLAGTRRAVKRVERMKFQRSLLPAVPFEVRLTPGAMADRADFLDEKGVFATARVVLRQGNG